MEAAQTFENPNSFEVVWTILRESAERHKEIELILKETAKRQDETDRQMKETNEQIGRLGNRFEELARWPGPLFTQR